MNARKVSPRAKKNKIDSAMRDRGQTDAAAERGERIETSKAIARGGKKEGHVPGAMASPRRR
jgi:hypothetical protein